MILIINSSQTRPGGVVSYRASLLFSSTDKDVAIEFLISLGLAKYFLVDILSIRLMLVVCHQKHLKSLRKQNEQHQNSLSREGETGVPYYPLRLGTFNLEEVYLNLHEWRVTNHFWKIILGTPDQDLDPHITVIDRLVYCENDTFGHAATEAGFKIVTVLLTRAQPVWTLSAGFCSETEYTTSELLYGVIINYI
uniref:Uncharacterized protein n=1 Tax=Timema shepardi TaxID=629360 RepID=A0A7R9AYS8_TIMSH|nr:unnamed protein product [Timema shepardi]